MLLSYHSIAKMTYTDQTSQPHHLTLLLEKKNMKLRKLYTTEEPRMLLLLDLMEGIFSQRRLLCF